MCGVHSPRKQTEYSVAKRGPDVSCRGTRLACTGIKCISGVHVWKGRQNADLDDGSDELDEEARQLHEGGIEGVEVVHDQPLDVRAIVILICHDHQMTIAKLLDISVDLRGATESSSSALTQRSGRVTLPSASQSQSLLHNACCPPLCQHAADRVQAAQLLQAFTKHLQVAGWANLAMLQAHDLLDGLNLCIGCNLGRTGITHIQELAPGQQASSHL